MHGLARKGIENVMSSHEQCIQFQTTLLSPLYSPAVHQTLIESLHSYLNEIRSQLPVPLLLEVRGICLFIEGIWLKCKASHGVYRDSLEPSPRSFFNAHEGLTLHVGTVIHCHFKHKRALFYFLFCQCSSYQC